MSSPSECSLSSETLQSPTESANRNERQGPTPHTGPNIVKVSTMEAGPRSAEVMMEGAASLMALAAFPNLGLSWA